MINFKFQTYHLVFHRSHWYLWIHFFRASGATVPQSLWGPVSCRHSRSTAWASGFPRWNIWGFSQPGRMAGQNNNQNGGVPPRIYNGSTWLTMVSPKEVIQVIQNAMKLPFHHVNSQPAPRRGAGLLLRPLHRLPGTATGSLALPAQGRWWSAEGDENRYTYVSLCVHAYPHMLINQKP